MKLQNITIHDCSCSRSHRSAILHVSLLADEVDVHGACRRVVQLAVWVRRYAVLWPRRVHWQRRLHYRPRGQGDATAASPGDTAWRHDRGLHWFSFRPDSHSPPRHSVCDDHAGPFATGLLRVPSGPVHQRRGRYPECSARSDPWPAESRQPHRDVLLHAGDNRSSVVWHISSDQFSFRPNSNRNS